MMNMNVDVVMSMYNSIEYCDNYSKTSGSLWKYCRDEPALIDPGTVENLPGYSASFKSKANITGKTHLPTTTKYQHSGTIKIPK